MKVFMGRGMGFGKSRDAWGGRHRPSGQHRLGGRHRQSGRGVLQVRERRGRTMIFLCAHEVEF
ncbi:hypothetical protein BGY98DRAFT_536461 [Russula aff. rugulosa BPL654]|nr:hypothetical protein BGY98DRAFT_536461 [Russula aff. rugulosa BPL654]